MTINASTLMNIADKENIVLLIKLFMRITLAKPTNLNNKKIRKLVYFHQLARENNFACSDFALDLEYFHEIVLG